MTPELWERLVAAARVLGDEEASYRRYASAALYAFSAWLLPSKEEGLRLWRQAKRLLLLTLATDAARGALPGFDAVRVWASLRDGPAPQTEDASRDIARIAVIVLREISSYPDSVPAIRVMLLLRALVEDDPGESLEQAIEGIVLTGAKVLRESRVAAESETISDTWQHFPREIVAVPHKTKALAEDAARRFAHGVDALRAAAQIPDMVLVGAMAIEGEADEAMLSLAFGDEDAIPGLLRHAAAKLSPQGFFDGADEKGEGR